MSISTNWRQLLHRVCCCQEADHGRRPANWSPDGRLERYIANIASLDRCLATIGNTMVNEPQKNRPDGLVKNPIVDDGKFEKMKNHESQPETIKKKHKNTLGNHEKP